MSGDFRPEQNQTIESTDDPALAQRYGLTSFNKSTGQWERPRSDVGVRDGEDAERARHDAADDEGKAQHAAEHGEGQDVTADDERKPGAPTKAAPAKSTGSQSKK